MTRLFDTALPPFWYIAFWVGLVILVRLWLVKPLLTALAAVARAQRCHANACTSPAEPRSLSAETRAMK